MTTDRQTFYVTADHKVEAYRFKDHPVVVSPCAGGEGYYANASKLGCSKTYRTPEIAIRELFHDHACFNIIIARKPS